MTEFCPDCLEEYGDCACKKAERAHLEWLRKDAKKGGGHVHWDGYCYDAGMRFNEEDCQGGGRESGNPGSVGGAESTRAAAANPVACPVGRSNDPGDVHVAHDERIRELEAELSAFHAVVASPDEAMEIVIRAEKAEARVKELEAEHAECPRPRPEREDG